MSSLSGQILAIRLQIAQSQFEACKQSGVIEGDFQDKCWQYRGKNILFTEVNPDRRRSANAQGPLPTVADQLARCYAIKEILRQQSGELLVMRLAAFRHLAWIVAQHDGSWETLTKTLLDKTVAAIQQGRSNSTVYSWATSLNTFVEFLNQFSAKIDGIEHRFTDRFIRWTHGIPNATRSALELTSSEFSQRQQELYTPDLHIGLARARSMVKDDPSLEPSPGYDRIRLEATGFAMALGLRVGEVCGLPKNCLETDTDTGSTFVRVPTEKGALCAATAVAQTWVEPLNEAFSYLSDSCQSARHRALEIETSGFRFIDTALHAQRTSHPLDTVHLHQLNVAGLAPEQHYFIEELTACLPVSSKEFTAGGRFHHCTQPLPRFVAARMVSWLDQRFEQWDWPSYVNTFKVRQHSLSVIDIGNHCGMPKSSIMKATWFVSYLREMLKEMQQHRLFHPEQWCSPAERDHWRERWQGLRTRMLSRRGGAAGGPCMVVDLDQYKRALETKFRHYLQLHFREQFPMPVAGEEAAYFTKAQASGHVEKLSDHLIVVWENQFNSRAQRGVIPRPILRPDFYNYLCANSSKLTIFQRLKLTAEDGQPYSISPHHIRRWVTTAVLRAGPSELAVDLWMGRSPHQTRHYDYRTAKERAEYVRSVYMTDNPAPDYLGKKIIHWRAQALSDEQIEQMVIEKLKVLNYTPWGACSRELYLNPCNKGLMCLRGFGTQAACESFHIDVKDLTAKASITTLKADHEQMLRSVLGHYDDLATDISQELDSHQTLDQHILFMLDIVRGCTEALKVYDAAQSDQIL